MSDMQQVNYIQEWSIVQLEDGRKGVLSHHFKSPRSLVMLNDGTGVEIHRGKQLRVMLTAAQGMRKMLDLWEGGSL